MLPLEERQCLVDHRQNVAAFVLVRLDLDGLVKLIDRLLKLGLVEQEFTIIVVDVGHLLEVLGAPPEGRRGRGDRAHLVLSYTELDMGENEVLVQVNGLLVIACGLGKLILDEVQLRTVIVNIGVVLVLLEGPVEVLNSFIGSS